MFEYEDTSSTSALPVAQPRNAVVTNPETDFFSSLHLVERGAGRLIRNGISRRGDPRIRPACDAVILPLTAAASPSHSIRYRAP